MGYVRCLFYYLFLYSNEAYTYKEYSNVCEFSISLNNETFFKSEYSGDDEGLYSEERWNYAYLEQDDKDMLDEKEWKLYLRGINKKV